MTSVVRPLTSSELQSAVTQSNQIAAAATRTVTGNQFVFLAAFDGTRNNRADLILSGSPKSTNVAQIEEQLQQGNIGNPNFASKYYVGVGTGSPLDWTAGIPTGEIVARAEQAYTDFNKAAQQKGQVSILFV
jgi:hypothetical protein